MALDASIGTGSANAYATLDEANAYFATCFNRTVWIDATDPNKEASLIEATRQIDLLFDWIGIINSVDQSLGWPRKLIDSHNLDTVQFIDIGLGYPLDKNPCDGLTIPKELKIAVYEFAEYILNGGFSLEEQTIDKVKVGSLDIRFSNNIRTSIIPKIVIEALRKIGEFRVPTSGAAHTVKLVRA